eukprot:Phypoly_transcript_04055.p1 GENE.Phypoly_transcript_04055~~Phypoly_transcript_04055.p1  ORF type:complete len:159 (+),score=1.61 Phypoly_transcript_04055:490-966(+)
MLLDKRAKHGQNRPTCKGQGAVKIRVIPGTPPLLCVEPTPLCILNCSFCRISMFLLLVFGNAHTRSLKSRAAYSNSRNTSPLPKVVHLLHESTLCVQFQQCPNKFRLSPSLKNSSNLYQHAILLWLPFSYTTSPVATNKAFMQAIFVISHAASFSPET